MTVIAGVHKKYKGYFFFEEVHLRKLNAILEEFAAKKVDEKPQLLFSVYRSDNSFYTTENVDEVLADENSELKRIKKIDIELREKGHPNKAEKTICKIMLDAEENIVTVEITHVERDQCILLADEINNQILRFETKNKIVWYLNNCFVFQVLLFVGLLWGFSLVIERFYLLFGTGVISESALGEMSLDQKMDSLLLLRYRSSSFFSVLLFLVAITASFIGAILVPVKRIQKLLFVNRSIFSWGDALRQFEEEKSLRTKIRWSLFISPFALFAVKVLWDKFL